jgi:hypothetical protein
MVLLIGLVEGTQDFPTLIALVLLTFAMQLNGFAIEANLKGLGRVSKSARDSILGSSIAAWTLFVALWFVFVYTFANLVNDVKTLWAGVTPPSGGTVEVPGWVYFIVIAQIIFFASFGAVQAWHVYERLRAEPNPNFSYLNVEAWYILLSFIAKINLGAGIGYGLLFRTKDCPLV